MWPFRKKPPPEKPQPTRALSLLPPDEVRGGLPSYAVLGTFAGGAPDSLEGFSPNPEFAALLHREVRALLESDPEFLAAAQRQQTGWIYTIDARHRRDEAGKIPMQDIVCGVRVEAGAPIFEEYFANPDYEVFSPQRGIMHLPGGLHQRFVERLIARVRGDTP